MNILRQLFWFRAAIIGAVVFLVGAAVFCVLEIRSVTEAEAWTARTNDVLDGIADAERSMHLADYAGWVAIVNPEATPQVQPFRNSAIERLDRLLKHSDTEPSQRENFEQIRSALLERFVIQDTQRAAAKRIDGKIVFDLPTIEKAITTAQNVDVAFADTRFDERALLIDRTEIRNASHRRLVTGLIICAVLSIICTLALVVRMVRELKLRQNVAKLITQQKPGELPPWMQEIHQIIEGADRDRANIKHYLLMTL